MKRSGSRPPIELIEKSGGLSSSISLSSSHLAWFLAMDDGAYRIAVTRMFS
jgi:hypothetical protein